MHGCQAARLARKWDCAKQCTGLVPAVDPVDAVQGRAACIDARGCPGQRCRDSCSGGSWPASRLRLCLPRVYRSVTRESTAASRASSRAGSYNRCCQTSRGGVNRCRCACARCWLGAPARARHGAHRATLALWAERWRDTGPPRALSLRGALAHCGAADEASCRESQPDQARVWLVESQVILRHACLARLACRGALEQHASVAARPGGHRRSAASCLYVRRQRSAQV